MSRNLAFHIHSEDYSVAITGTKEQIVRAFEKIFNQSPTIKSAINSALENHSQQLLDLPLKIHEIPEGILNKEVFKDDNF